MTGEGKANSKDSQEKLKDSNNFVQQLEQLRDMFQSFGPELAGMNQETSGLEDLGKEFFSSDNQGETKSLAVIAENTKELRKLATLSLETQREIKAMLTELIEITRDKN